MISAEREKSAGRLVGVLLLLHVAVGLIAPFVLLDRVIGGQGFLVQAAGLASQTRTAVFLLFVGSSLAIAVTCAGWRVFRVSGSAMALWLFALAVAAFTLQAVDNAHILSLLSLSERYAGSGAANADLFQALAMVIGAARKWAHYSALLTVGCWIALFFGVLYRFRLAPRWLAAAGVAGAMLQVGGVTVRGLLGLSPETRLAIPLAPIYVLMSVWLMVRGFEGPRARRADAEAH
jgi:Domain of unknown function (DUF4386)